MKCDRCSLEMIRRYIREIDREMYTCPDAMCDSQSAEIPVEVRLRESGAQPLL